MNKYLILIFIILTGCSSADQEKDFEGIIAYKVTVSSYRNSPFTDDFQKELGDTIKIYFKSGMYRMDYNGSRTKYTIYKNTSNKQYTILNEIDTLFIDDCSIEKREIMHTRMETSDKEILNHKCNKFIALSGADTLELHYSPDLYMSPSKFKDHKFSHMNIYYENCHSPYLEFTRRGKVFTLNYKAVSIEEKEIDDSVFTIPDLPVSSLAQR